MMKELQLHLRFTAMILQAYKSLQACKNRKHYLNVWNGWIKRLETEFPLNDRRSFSLEVLKLVWRSEIERYSERVTTGDEIIQTAFNDSSL